MFKYVLLSLTAIIFFSFCTSPKTSAEKEKKEYAQIMKTTTVTFIEYQNGKKQERPVSAQFADTIANIALYLVTMGEPLRLHLSDEQMNNLFLNATGFELLFEPPIVTNETSSTQYISKILFLTSGNHANSAQINDARFFFALSDNNQYIQSPYVADGEAGKVIQLQQLLLGE